MDAQAGPCVTLRRNSTVEHLNNRRVSCLSDSRLLGLLCQQRHESLLNLGLTRQAGQFETDLRHLCKRNGEITPVSISNSLDGDVIAILHLAKVSVHLVNSSSKSHKVGICLRCKIPHHLKLNFGGNDLTLQPRRSFNRSPRLLLEYDGTISFLKST